MEETWTSKRVIGANSRVGRIKREIEWGGEEERRSDSGKPSWKRRSNHTRTRGAANSITKSAALLA